MASLKLSSAEPIHLNEPMEDEVSQAKLLNQTVESSGFYESNDSLKARKQIVDALKQMIFLWVHGVADQKSKQIQSKVPVDNYGTKVLPFGGQAIGVVRKGGDVDVVCVAPKFIQKEDFFSTLVHRLEDSKDVQNIRKIEGAYVPVLQFTFQAIKIDLCLAVLRFENVPVELSFSGEDVLLNIDQLSVRSLSGIRDVLELLSLVPNHQNFVETLKTVKMWAICQGIHGSAFGYPGGIAWTIMVARVCQMYPLASVSMLVYQFFQVISQWNWPQPVLLKPLLASPPDKLLDTCVQWDSKKNPSDRCHIMPVITPSFPEHNSCFTVNSSSKGIILNCLTQAKSLCEKIIRGQSEWSTLFVPVDFFSLYKHYLMVTASAESDKGMLDWCGFLESQLRKLVEGLQVQQAIQQIHLFPKSYHNGGSRNMKWFIGLKLHKMSSSTLDLSTPMHSFAEQSKLTAAERGLLQDDMKIEIMHVPRKQLQKYVDMTPGT